MITTKMIINGEWVDNIDGQYIEVENPATEEVFARVPTASEANIHEAVEAAEKAFKEWSRLSPEKRAVYLMKASELVREREDKLAEMMTKEQGKPFNEARGEVRKGAEILQYYAEEGKRAHGRIIPGYDASTTSYVIYQPVGVSVAISPWNYPIELVGWKIGGALAAGCTVVLKPPSETPLSSTHYVKCVIDAGVPAGVVNVVFGRGSYAGPLLIKHPLVQKVAFTGSTEVGKSVIKECAEHMKKVSLELGGSCPLIVSKTCKLEEAVKGAVRRTFRNMGQICISINRIYVAEEIYHDFLEAFVEATKKLTIANGLEKPDADVGPMANKEGIEKTTRHIEDAVQKGAKMLCGGKRPDGEEFKKGYFFLPTILADVTHEMLIMREETFGPAVGVMPYKTLDEAHKLCKLHKLWLSVICVHERSV